MTEPAVKKQDRVAPVIVVDDHPIVRVGIAQLVNHEEDMAVCGETGNAEEAMQLVRKHRPAVAIVDLRLDDTDGLELTRQIKAFDAEIKVLIVSGFDESAYAEDALHAGASGYIEKLETIDLLVRGIRQVLAGEVFLSSRMTERVLRHAAEGEEYGKVAPVQRLSPRESQIYELMGQGYTTRQIAERLEISTKTVETYRDNIKNKMDISSVNEMIRRAVDTLYQRRA